MKIARWYAVVDKEGNLVHSQRFITRSMIDIKYHPSILADDMFCGIRDTDEKAIAAARAKARKYREQ